VVRASWPTGDDSSDRAAAPMTPPGRGPVHAEPDPAGRLAATTTPTG
jgi:hypothetical protein